ncbi:hypothetical protein F909_03027 [Acinetobacter sp. ANC 3929]|uniref:hypothetical protein n=1 Tax=unclassified Acinetobacter TaxID=196816 RepID=UPI0002CEB40C|nr:MULTISPECIES: hypothetical protein [unclassified Acinetobacter]ENW79923.1 hypothetical protein F909_03027 [Acinetobacter sp. ANC 3929]MCH7352713.1 hypothetical protein [Acinetobacter sp. NIPH 2023]MCH7357166.1 hypothetical protein [Acinetobacter sp. NIPH 1958]MCH7360107.1 hypothetical protein [Acinetobacter sp. NIPH 2024]
MSTKRYVARELLEQHTKQKKQEKLEQRRLALEQRAKEKRQAKIHITLLIIVFILPLFLFPAYPRNQWQYEIYRYITEHMLITVGTKGPLPFFTILSSIYFTFVASVFGFYLCFLFIKSVGVNKEFQEKIYSKFFQAEFDASKKYPWLEKPLIKKTIVSGMFFFCFLMGMIHFLLDNISFQDGSRRGALIQLGYNYRIGVLLWESTFSVFTIFPFFYFGLLFIYLCNYFFRGLGTGKIIIPKKVISKRTKKRSREK